MIVYFWQKMNYYDFNIPNDTYIYYLGGLLAKDKPFMPIKTNVNKTNILIDTDHFKLACAYIKYHHIKM